MLFQNKLGLAAHELYTEWRAVKDDHKWDVVPVWVDDIIIDRVRTWTKKNAGLIWVSEVALGERLEEVLSLPYFHEMGKDRLSRDVETMGPENGSIVLSVSSNSEGRNLQHWSKNLIISPPPTGTTWEQCLDSETEVLTNCGWLGIDSDFDCVGAAAYDIEDGSIRWAEASKFERTLGDGEEMYGISNPHLDIRVTGGHRMVHQGIRRFGNGGKDGFEYTPRRFVRADELLQRGRIPIAGEQVAKGVQLTNPELMWLGLLLSDGNIDSTNNAASLFQSDRYPEIVALCERVLKECGFKYKHSLITTPSNFGPRKHPLHKWQVSFGSPKKGGGKGWGHLKDYADKDFSNRLLDMTREQLLVFLYGLWAGDGSKTVGTYHYDKYKPGTINIACRPSVADKVQSLCVRRGLRSNVSKVTPKLCMLRVSDDTSWSVLNMQVSDGRPTWARVASTPDERVWCVKVETGAIVTRRNGKVAVVGNCLGRTHRRGQEADEVEVDVLIGCEVEYQCWRQAIQDSHYGSSMENPKKLTYATIDQAFRLPPSDGMLW